MTALSRTAATLSGGPTQTVRVFVRDGYHPDSITVRAGIPLRIAFRREDDDPCTERVVFSTPHVERRLVGAGTTVVELPAQPTGRILFTCGMGKYRGRIDVVPARAGLLAQLAGLIPVRSLPLGGPAMPARDPVSSASSSIALRNAGRDGGIQASRPAWLLPAVALVVLGAALAFLGIIPVSTVLYAGMVGGMLVMHLGGHGHGVHGVGHERHGPVDEETLPSDGSPTRIENRPTDGAAGREIAARLEGHAPGDGRGHGCH